MFAGRVNYFRQTLTKSLAYLQNLAKLLQHKISWTFTQSLKSYYMQSDRRTDWHGKVWTFLCDGNTNKNIKTEKCLQSKEGVRIHDIMR
jgi:hypothetical protein